MYPILGFARAWEIISKTEVSKQGISSSWLTYEPLYHPQPS